jgi:hypothetical protein
VAVEQLAQDYAGKSVVFLEYDVDSSALYPREGRWWHAHGSGTVQLPLIMVDSGNQITNGSEDFYNKYKSMVDASLSRDAQAAIVASGERMGDTLHFDVQMTNQGSVTLGPSNYATVWAIVYEVFDTSGAGRLTKRFVHAVASTSLSADIAPGGTGSYTLDTGTLSGVDWDNLRAIVLVDYLPSGLSGAYDMLQAVSISSFQ